jgi:hypothetical protein
VSTRPVSHIIPACAMQSKSISQSALLSNDNFQWVLPPHRVQESPSKGEAVTGATLSMAAYIIPARVSAHQRLITTTKLHLRPQPRQQEGLSLDGASGSVTETLIPFHIPAAHAMRQPCTQHCIQLERSAYTRSSQHRCARSLTHLYRTQFITHSAHPLPAF